MKDMEDTIVAWAERQTSIRALIISGSRARQTHPADAWSDLDIEIYTTDLTAFLPPAPWVHELGPVWVCLPFLEEGNPVILTLFEHAEKIDFHIYPVEDLQHRVITQQLPDSCQRGYTIRVDKDALATQLPAPSSIPPAHEPPTLEQFRRTSDHFWFGAVYVARQIRRRNLWVAKFRDWTMKQELLRMLEWKARAMHGATYETWYEGHWLSEWTDEPTWQALQQTFGRLNVVDSWAALRAAMELFRRSARQTADHYGLAYPEHLDRDISVVIERLYQDDPDVGTPS